MALFNRQVIRPQVKENILGNFGQWHGDRYLDGNAQSHLSLPIRIQRPELNLDQCLWQCDRQRRDRLIKRRRGINQATLLSGHGRAVIPRHRRMIRPNEGKWERFPFLRLVACRGHMTSER